MQIYNIFQSLKKYFKKNKFFIKISCIVKIFYELCILNILCSFTSKIKL